MHSRSCHFGSSFKARPQQQHLSQVGFGLPLLALPSYIPQDTFDTMYSTQNGMYEQPDFVPQELIMQFMAAGNMVQPIFEWLQIPYDAGAAMMAAVGGALIDHISCISHIIPADWEGLFATNVITSATGEVPVNLITKGKRRQVLITARQVVGVIREPATQAPPVTTALVATSAASSSLDPLTSVNVNDTIAQGVEPIRVPLMTDEYFQDTME